MIQEYSDKITFNLLISQQSYVKDFHLHNFYELFLLLEGEVKFCVQQTFYHLTRGSLILINDLEIHKSINQKEVPYKRIYIHIPPAFFKNMTPETSILPPVLQHGIQGKEICSSLQKRKLHTL